MPPRQPSGIRPSGCVRGRSHCVAERSRATVGRDRRGSARRSPSLRSNGHPVMQRFLRLHRDRRTRARPAGDADADALRVDNWNFVFELPLWIRAAPSRGTRAAVGELVECRRHRRHRHRIRPARACRQLTMGRTGTHRTVRQRRPPTDCDTPVDRGRVLVQPAQGSRARFGPVVNHGAQHRPEPILAPGPPRGTTVVLLPVIDDTMRCLGRRAFVPEGLVLRHGWPRVLQALSDPPDRQDRAISLFRLR